MSRFAIVLCILLTLDLSAAELANGPMIGYVTDSTAKIWARTNAAVSVKVVFGTDERLKQPTTSAATTPSKDYDWTTVVELSELRPRTRYFYNVLVKGKPALEPPLPSFRTLPALDSKTRVRVTFGGGIRFQVDPEQTLWNDIAAREPDVMLLMGDNTYPDNYIKNEALLKRDLGGNEQLLMKKENGWRGRSGFLFHRVYYRIQQSVPNYQRFIARHPIYAVWDDHDAYHDGQGGASKPIELRQESIQTFRENFALPYYGNDDAPGTWCHFTVPGAEFFLLDARTYRTRGGGKEARFLGEAEERWLKDHLLASRAPFKFIVCGSPWNNQPKTGAKVLTDENYYDATGDTLASFKFHRDRLLNFIIHRRIPGVILLSGDRHRADIVKVWPRNRPDQIFWDFNNCNISSRTQRSVGEPGDNGLVFSFSGRCFGLLDIDTTTDPPTVTHEIWGKSSRSKPAEMKYRMQLKSTAFLPDVVQP